MEELKHGGFPRHLPLPAWQASTPSPVHRGKDALSRFAAGLAVARLRRVRAVLVLSDCLQQLLVQDQVKVRLVRPHVLVPVLLRDPVDLLLLEAPVLDPAAKILQSRLPRVREGPLTTVTVGLGGIG